MLDVFGGLLCVVVCGCVLCVGVRCLRFVDVCSLLFVVVVRDYCFVVACCLLLFVVRCLL